MADAENYRVREFSARELAELLKEQAKLGAEEALRELGLEKPEDRNDLKEALEVARIWKRTKASIWDTTVKVITTAILGALALGMALGIIKQVP